MSLTSVDASIWNEIAKTQTLKTAWAKKAFSMDQNQMAEAENREYQALKRMAGPEVAAAFLDMKPLLLERRAITQFTLEHPNFRQALPEIASVSEAVIYASMDRPLNQKQQKALMRLLRADLT